MVIKVLTILQTCSTAKKRRTCSILANTSQTILIIGIYNEMSSFSIRCNHFKLGPTVQTESVAGALECLSNLDENLSLCIFCLEFLFQAMKKFFFHIDHCKTLNQRNLLMNNPLGKTNAANLAIKYDCMQSSGSGMNPAQRYSFREGCGNVQRENESLQTNE